MRKNSIIYPAVLTDIILNYFLDVIGGYATDYAWMELLEKSEVYLNKPNKDFQEYLSLVFNIDTKAFKKITEDYKKRIKIIEKEYYGL